MGLAPARCEGYGQPNLRNHETMDLIHPNQKNFLAGRSSSPPFSKGSIVKSLNIIETLDGLKFAWYDANERVGVLVFSSEVALDGDRSQALDNLVSALQGSLTTVVDSEVPNSIDHSDWFCKSGVSLPKKLSIARRLGFHKTASPLYKAKIF
jgi:hypothetical protein